MRSFVALELQLAQGMFRSVYFGSISPAWTFFLEGTVVTGVPGGASGVPKGRMWGARGLGRRTPTFQRTRALVPNYFPARRGGASLDVIERKGTGEKGLLYRRAAIGPSAIENESGGAMTDAQNEGSRSARARAIPNCFPA